MIHFYTDEASICTQSEFLIIFTKLSFIMLAINNRIFTLQVLNLNYKSNSYQNPLHLLSRLGQSIQLS
jgi:hypothetical protein